MWSPSLSLNTVDISKQFMLKIQYNDIDESDRNDFCSINGDLVSTGRMKTTSGQLIKKQKLVEMDFVDILITRKTLRT